MLKLTKYLKYVFLSLFLLLFSSSTYGQIWINSYVETGSHAVSHGTYGDLSGQIEARKGRFTTSVGGLLSVMKSKNHIFSAFLLSGGTDFKVYNKKFALHAFYLFKPISAIIHETNIGLMGVFKRGKMGYKVGLHSYPPD